MKEITIDIDEEINKARSDYESIISESTDKKVNQEDIDKAENKLGQLETIKEDYGNFTITLKKFTMRESTTMEEIAMGIQGGVKNVGKMTITQPNILLMKVHAIKFGIKGIEPMVFDFKDNNAIMELDNSLFEYIYNEIDRFNGKNWTFRKKERNS